MGFFSKLFGLSSQASTKTPEPAAPSQPAVAATRTKTKKIGPHKLTFWPDFVEKDSLELPLGELLPIYVYDSSSLGWRAKGDKIKLEVLLGDAKLKSKANGAIVDTVESNAMCFLYKGKPIGVKFNSRFTAEAAYERGIKLFVQGEVGGKLRNYPGITEVFVNMPRSWGDQIDAIKEAAFKADAKAKGIGEGAELIAYNEWDPEDYEELLSREEWEFEDVQLAYLPVPKGSKAKPHITLTSKQGILISRVTARNWGYHPLAEAMERHTNFYATAQRRGSVSGDGHMGYHIKLWCW